jgi:hypothetical protein
MATSSTSLLEFPIGQRNHPIPIGGGNVVELIPNNPRRQNEEEWIFLNGYL